LTTPQYALSKLNNQSAYCSLSRYIWFRQKHVFPVLSGKYLQAVNGCFFR